MILALHKPPSPAVHCPVSIWAYGVVRQVANDGAFAIEYRAVLGEVEVERFVFQAGVSRALGQVVSVDGERRQRESGERSRTAFTLVTDPDPTVLRTADGALRVRVDGLDAYNPQSGQAEPADARRVSCMMVDTDFDGESFFARRVNFPNVTRGCQDDRASARGIQPRDRRREAGDDEESASTVPFDRPESGLIAVKIVDHAGTAHEKVIDLNGAAIEME